MNSQSMAKTKKTTGAGKTVTAIERLVPRGGKVHFKADAHYVETLAVNEDWDYYVVKNDDFSPIAPKGSLLHVFINIEGDDKAERNELALVSANNRLELRAAAECAGVQLIGIVWEIRRWPTMNVSTMHDYKDSEIQAFPSIG